MCNTKLNADLIVGSSGRMVCYSARCVKSEQLDVDYQPSADSISQEKALIPSPGMRDHDKQ